MSRAIIIWSRSWNTFESWNGFLCKNRERHAQLRLEVSHTGFTNLPEGHCYRLQIYYCYWYFKETTTGGDGRHVKLNFFLLGFDPETDTGLITHVVIVLISNLSLRISIATDWCFAILRRRCSLSDYQQGFPLCARKLTLEASSTLRASLETESCLSIFLYFATNQWKPGDNLNILIFSMAARPQFILSWGLSMYW